MIACVCVGNGVRVDGTPSAPSRAVVDQALNFVEVLGFDYIIFSGGWRIHRGGTTEAEAMMSYALDRRLDLNRRYLLEDRSYRTHNNAIEALRVTKIYSYGEEGGIVFVCDHPLHLPRTFLALKVVNRILHESNFNIMLLAAREVYDDIPGQPQLRNRRTFAAHERKGMLLYRALLFRPWARFGLSLLTRIWPSEKQ